MWIPGLFVKCRWNWLPKLRSINFKTILLIEWSPMRQMFVRERIQLIAKKNVGEGFLIWRKSRPYLEWRSQCSNDDGIASLRWESQKVYRDSIHLRNDQMKKRSTCKLKLVKCNCGLLIWRSRKEKQPFDFWLKTILALKKLTFSE